MARPIVLGNGELHVGLNEFNLVHDFYYPHVGLENHTLGQGTRHKVGVWVDGQLSWLSDGNWNIHARYPYTALVGHTVVENFELGVRLEFDDFVDSDMSAFMRNIHVINLFDRKRDIRIFMHQAFVIGDSRGNTDTVQYLPDSEAVLHYRGRRAFVISGTHNGEPFDQRSVGLFGIEGREGTWKDAYDGELSNGTVEHGRVDSTIRFKLDIDAHSSERIHYWVAAGTSLRDALYIHKTIREDGLIHRMYNTIQWWHRWLEPVAETFEDYSIEYRQQALVSAMILRAHVDNHGGVIASADSSLLNYGRDAYAYCWPRDAVYVLWPLLRLGYTDEILRFFDFARRGMHPHGYLAHKYRADGAIGSSWHPYLHHTGEVAPPIQEDETAAVVFLFAQFYQTHESPRLIQEYYDSMIKPMANFMAEYRYEDTLLPKHSYDLWEERHMTSTYTTAITYAALQAAADLAEVASDDESAVSWRAVADDMHTAAGQRFFNGDLGYIIKGIYREDDEIHEDETFDISSFFGSFMYGLFTVDSYEMKRTVTKIEEIFRQSEHIALPRYYGDNYRRRSGESNYWHVTSLWYAQYCIEVGNIEMAEKILDWCIAHKYESGVMGEQVDPQTGYTVSPAPLAWSHAEYLTTLLDLHGIHNEHAES